MREPLNRLYWASNWFAALNVLAIATVVLAQVALNLVDRLSAVLGGQPLGLVVPSYAEFAGCFLAVASFAALASTFHAGGHIRVTLVLARVGRGANRALDLWSHGVAAAVSGFFTYNALALAWESWRYGDVSPGLVPVPLWLPQSAMAIGLALLTVAIVDSLGGCLGQRRAPVLPGTTGLVSGADQRTPA
jgi:TRAP-type C4-dicarboxylate transport system permease small subunit